MTVSGAMRILVTGAGGFVGANVVTAARAAGHLVFPAYRSPGRIDGVRVDVTDEDSVQQAFRQSCPTHVVHCAAYGVDYRDQDEQSAIEVNLLGTLRVLRAAADAGVQHFLHLGSCSEYGSKEGPILETDELNPTAVYGATKAAATVLVRERADALGVPLTVARLFATWGPGEAPFRLVPQVVNACLERTPLSLTPCDVVRDYCYVEDAVSVMLMLLGRKPDDRGTVVNIGSGRPLILREFVLDIARRLGGENLMKFGELPHRPTEMKFLVPDITKLRNLIGSIPVTAIDEGLRRMTRTWSMP